MKIVLKTFGGSPFLQSRRDEAAEREPPSVIPYPYWLRPGNQAI